MAYSPYKRIVSELSLSEKIEQQILEAIRRKFFLPGEKLLSEMELAKNFGVSRTAVREALHRLAGRGVVEIRKNSGVIISPDQYAPVTNSFFNLLEMKCGDSSLLDIANVRLIIEPEIVALAALKRTESDIKELKRLYAEMKADIDNPDEMIRHDIDFHRILTTASKNPILPVIMEPLFQLLRKFMSDTYEYPHSPKLAIESHYNILQSIENKDKKKAFQAMKLHMTEAKEHASVIIKAHTSVK